MVNTRREFLRWGLSSALAASAPFVGTASAGATPTGAAPAGTASAGDAARGDPFDQLRRVADGQLVRPDDPEYRTARRGQIREFDDRRPTAVLYASGVEDVRRAVLFSQDEGIALSIRSGGHHLQGWSTGDGLVLDLARVRPRTTVTGPDAVEVGPANTSLDTLERIAPHGLALPTGICATVCSGGFVSGGGIGLLTPHGGLASDHLQAAEVVLADGRVVTASPDSEPDLLWALRGGGSNFGVITGYTLRPEHLRRVTNYVLAWPFDSADRVASAWQHWQAERPDALGSAIMLLSAGETAGAVPMVVVMGTWAGPAETLQPHLAELVDQAEALPLVNLSLPQSYRDAMLQWWAFGATLPARPVAEDLLGPPSPASDPSRTPVQRPALRTIQGRFFDRPMPPDAIDRWIDAFASDPLPGQTRISMGLRTGGRAGRPSRTSTAYVHRDASFHLDFSTQQNVSADLAADKAAADAWTKRGLGILGPHSTGEAYLNFPESDLPDPQRAYWAENLDRLTTIKRHYDPHDVFAQPQGITAG